ncbi:hypothetical protein AAII07_22650 [Microvirga sp. 0TCS3.31]
MSVLTILWFENYVYSVYFIGSFANVRDLDVIEAQIMGGFL